MNQRNVLFIHGRPAGHPLHAKYGEAIGGQFSVEDPIIRWHDRDYPALYRYVAWLVNALCFVRLRKTVVVTEGLRITAVLAKLLSLKKTTLVGLIDDESPYFIHAEFYGPLSLRVNKWAYSLYDGFLCIGRMETELIKEIVAKPVPVFTGFNGVSSHRLQALNRCVYAPASKRIVFIGNGPSSWRKWYKGLDLMLAVFSDLVESGHDLYFDIVGEWNAMELTNSLGAEVGSRVQFVGKVTNLEPVLAGAALYLHTARGEAWGISINEAMAAGVVPIVSDWTGAKECVAQVSEKLVVEVDKVMIRERVEWFFQLEEAEKIRLSKKCREIVATYTEEGAVKHFGQMFDQLTTELE